MQYLQARRDMAFSWALRWPFRRRGGGERRHLRVQTLRKEGEEGANRDALKYHGLTQPNGCPTHTPTPRRIYGSSIHLFSPFYVTHHTRFIALTRILQIKPAILSVHIFLRYRRYHTTFHFAWTRHQVSANTIRASISAKSGVSNASMNLGQQQN